MSSTRGFYDSEYHFHQDVQRPHESRIRSILRRLQPLEGKTYFDLGCGAGWASRLAQYEGGAKHVIGLDFSRTALELAKGHTPEVLWVQADGTALPVADASVDALHCDGALEHFPDPNKGLAEVARILKPDGQAVILVPNFYVVTEQPLELRLSYWGWKQRIMAAGLRIERTGVDWGPPIFGTSNPLRSLKRLAGRMLGLIPFMQYQFVFVLKRAR
ncbi:MAG TPA: class I SAM-dependent methyltransferase [Tepidisphaeraceae bacterium]|nr:class I SAM-dependent methyltransferase [Tepidisphaeraceae bacterium]